MKRSFYVRVGSMPNAATAKSPTDALLGIIEERRNEINAAFGPWPMSGAPVKRSESNGRVTISIAETTANPSQEIS